MFGMLLQELQHLQRSITLSEPVKLPLPAKSTKICGSCIMAARPFLSFALIASIASESACCTSASRSYLRSAVPEGQIALAPPGAEANAICESKGWSPEQHSGWPSLPDTWKWEEGMPL